VPDEDKTIVAPTPIPREGHLPSLPSTPPHLSGVMYATARRFALEAQGGAPPRTALPVATVVLVCTALEAFVNEEIELDAASDAMTAASGGMAPAPAGRLRAKVEEKNLPLRQTWRKYLWLHGKLFDEKKEPYLAFDRLVELRNLVVQRSARAYSSTGFPKEAQAVRGRFEFTPPQRAAGDPWEQQVLNVHCARWACNTTVAIRAEHFRRLGRPDPGGWEPIGDT